MNKIKPLLASKAELDKIRYPVLATPKLDGIRCLMIDGVAMSRSMKPIPNQFVQDQLNGLPGFDGELMISGDFNQVQSAIMKKTGEPDFIYYVFDSHALPGKKYEERLEELRWQDSHSRVSILHPIEINNEELLASYLENCVRLGYEGIMIRQPGSLYKFGRSTVKEGILLKIKKFFDDEAILVEVIEKMTNTNELEEDDLGYAKRRSCKANLVPSGTAGSVVVKWNDIEFRVGFGPGVTDELKQKMWDNRERLLGRLYKFSYQELSRNGIPRFGKLIGERHEDDLK